MFRVFLKKYPSTHILKNKKVPSVQTVDELNSSSIINLSIRD